MFARTPTWKVRSLAPWLLASLLLMTACRPVPPSPKPAEPAATPGGAAPAGQVAPGSAPTAPAPTVAAAGVVATTAPAPASTAEPKRGGIMVIAAREDPPGNWDPMFQSSISLSYVASSIFGDGSIVRSCPEDLYKVCPALAESWEHNADFTEWTFRVRDGVFWHDGVQLTADEIKWWLDLAYNGVKVGDKTRPPARFKSNLGQITSTEVVDGNKVRIKLAVPTPYYLDLLASRNVQIANPKHLMADRIAAGEVMIGPADVGLIGLGPFKFVKADKGSVVQVRRFDKYWEKDAQGRQLPFLDGIDFPIITDYSAVLAAFRAGRLDGGTRGGGFTLLPDQIESLQKTFGDQVWFAAIGGQRQVLWFNVEKEGPLQDVRVRKAISLWLDKREGLQAIEGGNGLLTTLLDPRSPWPSPDWKTWPGYNEATRDADKAEAKRLMADASYANGFDIPLFGETPWADRYEWIQGNLAGLGVRVKLDLVDIPTYNDRSLRKDYAMQSSKGATITFPEGLSSLVNASSVANNAYPVHDDPKVIDLFNRFNTARDNDERVQMYRDLEKYILVDQVYGVPMYDETQTTPYRSYVKGLPVPPEDITANLSFATTWLDK
jgi:peptide/nickel transport system substrate-binding protein